MTKTLLYNESVATVTAYNAGESEPRYNKSVEVGMQLKAEMQKSSTLSTPRKLMLRQECSKTYANRTETNSSVLTDRQH